MGEGQAAWEKQNPGTVQEELARSLETRQPSLTHVGLRGGQDLFCRL